MSEQQALQRESGGGLASLALHNLAIVVSDMDAAIEWYGRVLDFRVVARAEIAEGEIVLMEGAGTQLELLHPSRLEEAQVRLDPLFADPPRHVLPVGNKFLVLQVDDLARASAELAERSVTFVWRETEKAPGFPATAIRDFDGNLINIMARH
jgi:catechol 2,3-dioxygenase-like lactoylglutathione lyase family enzyme